jgi:hypothetical protein
MAVGLFFAVALFFVSLPLRAEVEVSATLNTQSFPVDRVASLTLTASGVRSFTPLMPAVEGIIFHRRGQSTQMSLINGNYSALVTSVYLVEATRTGSFTIPPIELRNASGSHMTQAISFEVTAAQSAVVQAQPQSGKAAQARLGSGEADSVAFLRFTPVKEKSYSGEVVPVQIKVYFRDGIQVNLNSLPQLKGEGFVVEELNHKPEQTKEVINTTRYTVLTWNSSLSGIKEGAHDVSFEVEATLLLRQQRRRLAATRRNDPFGGGFFDDFFGGYREKEVKIASPVQSLTVLPLPMEGRPQGFSGAIGDFNMEVNASPLELSLGDPVTLKMNVSGEGNFDRVTVPQMAQAVKGWKSYTASSEFVEEGGAGKGKKLFEQALILKQVNVTEIPAMKFSYFDPEAGTYKVLRSDPIPIQVQGRVQEQSAPPPAQQEHLAETVPGQETLVETSSQPLLPGLAPLKTGVDTLDQELSPLFSRSWFQIVAVFFLLVILAAVLQRARKAHFARNPLLLRDKEMKGLLNERLLEMEQAQRNNDSRSFLTHCRRAIREQLGLLWGVEAAAITSADIKQRLDPESILLTVFLAADESAYGGEKLNATEMQEFAEDLKHELQGLI